AALTRSALRRARRRRGWLLALPRRLALAEERADALARVGRREDLRERGLLGLDALVEVRVAGCRALDRLDRERRLTGELARPRHRDVVQLVVGDDARREADLEGLRGGDRVAGEVELEGAGGPDEAWQALRAAEPGHDAE